VTVLTDDVRKVMLRVGDEADAVGALVTEGHDEEEAKALVRQWLAERASASGAFYPQPLAFDFDATPPAPDWLVRGVIERGTVAILSGDTGAAKSIVSSWLAVASLTGQDWLERTTTVGRVLIVDEENPEGLATARLRALGLRNGDRDRLRYFSREGFTLGTEQSDDRLTQLLAEFRPDLLVIDTLMSASAVDVNDNVAAVKMMKKLRGWAREYGCGVLVLHHERKQHRDGPSAGSGQQTMGARQWLGQADAALTIAVETDMQREELDAGGFKLRRTFKFRPAEKDRDGRLNGVRRIAVESEKDGRERLVWMTVTDEGPVTEASAKDDDAASILDALRGAEGDGWMGRKDIATVTGEKDPRQPSGTWKAALMEAVDAGKAEHVGQRYRITAEGRDAAGLPL
jgi:hypothetical protein